MAVLEAAKVVPLHDESAPFSVLLPVPVSDFTAVHPASGNTFVQRKKPGYEVYKAYLGRLSGEVLSSSNLGFLAVGLIEGRMSSLHTSVPSGLYEAPRDGRGITLLKPDVLYNNWPAEESRVHERMQVAMRNIIDAALGRRDIA
jgi:hypothetical protein